MYKVKIDKDAEKNLLKFDKIIRNRIIDFIKLKLSINPTTYSTLLVGRRNKFRARVGDYRIIFEIEERIIIILAIDHRSKIYR